MRLGWGVGHPELVTTLEAMLFAPYHLNAWQLAVAASYERLLPQVQRQVAQIVAERGRVERRLGELGVRFWPSRGNFVLFSTSDAAATHRRLLADGVRVRDVSVLPGLDEHLRVTIGAPTENDLFLDSLAASPG